MRHGAAVLVTVVAVLTGLAGAPSALGAAKPCRAGTVQIKLGGRATCVAKRLALPAPKKVAPALAQLQGALTVTQSGFKARSGKRAASLSQRAGRSWPAARSRVLKAMSTVLARLARPAAATTAAAADDPCAALDLIKPGQTFDDNGRPASLGGTMTVDGVDVTIGISRTGIEAGFKGTFHGDTYTMTYKSSELDCSKRQLPPCPEADGSLDGFQTKGQVGFTMTVQRGGKVLTRREFSETVTTETKGKVADDAKLDTVDVRYTEKTVYDNDGLRYTSHGTRLTQINMRNGSYGPGESVSIGSATQDGQSTNLAGLEANANNFAAFVGKTIDEYRARETAWQSPGTCAKLTFDPASSTLTVHRGATGTFSAQTVSTKSGEQAAKARWTLSAQQNGSFTPTSTNERAPSFSYTVASQPNGKTISVSVRATSTAGVAQDTWTQKLEDRLQTISGTFTGHATDLGVVYDWTGTATFTRTAIDADFGGPGGVFQLTAGQATVTVSGTDGECRLSGTSTIGLFPQSPWTVTGADAPFSYQIVAPFLPDPPQATKIDCANPADSGMPAGLGSMSAAALESGDIQAGANITGLVRTTNDATSYSGSASADGPSPDQSASWTWSFTGSLG